MKQIDKIIDYENGNLDLNETLELFSELLKTGVVWQLQGYYGRTAMGLIEHGFLNKNGDILKTE